MKRRVLVTAALVLGTVVLALAAVLGVVGRTIYNSSTFADHTASALEDPGVREFVADRVTGAIIGRKPDLIAIRPFVLAAASGLVGTRPFEELVRRAAKQAHYLTFSEGAERVVVALPDVGVLVRGVLEKASPAMVEKIPREVGQTLASLGTGKPGRVFLDVVRVGGRIWSRFLLLLVGGLVLLGLSVWLAPDRRRGTTRAGIALATAGLVLAAIVPLGRLALGAAIHDPLTAGAAQGLFAAYLGNLRTWGIAYLGVGLITAAGGAAFLDRFDPLAVLRRVGLRLVTPPERLLTRLGWGLGMLAVGIGVALRPSQVAAALVAVAGITLAYGGLRELFRMLGEWVASVPEVERVAARRGWSAPAMVAIGSTIAVLAIWLVFRNPFRGEAAPPPESASCNGSPLLCDRRVDQVVFAAAHNAMSNQTVPGWMFPHHEAGMPKMLEDGVRALAIDVFHGFPGGDRIKTDLKGKSAEKIALVVGAEGVAIAERIRNTLVGADEGRRGIFFCHGFCELGAYEVEPTLRQIRDFLVEHPDEVLILIIEDAIAPDETAAMLEEAGLAAMAYKGTPEPQWPTLRELIATNQRVIVFIESNTPGVPWLRPTLGQIQETPYSFKTPADFSCAPNRGGTTGSLFLINHWIETTPTPKPSNAAIVNAHDLLLARARQCEKERQKLPNIVMVDFYRTGDLVGVVAELNGVAADTTRQDGKAAGRQK